MTTIDRPDSPGLWERDGIAYRVWQDSGMNAEEVWPDPDHAIETYWQLHGLPTGNWRKLTVPQTNEEAKTKLLNRLNCVVLDNSPECAKTIADWGAEIFAGVTQEPGIYEKLYQHAIDCVDRVFQECTENPKPILPDFLGIGEDKFDGVVKLAEKYRAVSDKLAAVTDKLEKYKLALIERQDFCGAAAVKDCLQLLSGFEPKLLRRQLDAPTPEVIEGKGQRVTKAGWYLWESHHPEFRDGVVYLYTSNHFAEGSRYMRCPEFPPRPSFVAPPKPEQVLVLVRRKDGWAVLPCLAGYYWAKACESKPPGQETTKAPDA